MEDGVLFVYVRPAHQNAKFRQYEYDILEVNCILFFFYFFFFQKQIANVFFVKQKNKKKEGAAAHYKQLETEDLLVYKPGDLKRVQNSIGNYVSRKYGGVLKAQVNLAELFQLRQTSAIYRRAVFSELYVFYVFCFFVFFFFSKKNAKLRTTQHKNNTHKTGGTVVLVCQWVLITHSRNHNSKLMAMTMTTMIAKKWLRRNQTLEGAEGASVNCYPMK